MKAIDQRTFEHDIEGRLTNNEFLGSVLYYSSRRVRAAGTDNDIAIRLADSDGSRNSASMVVNRQYKARGYGSSHELPAAQSRVTFTASSSEKVFGTITLAADSSNGLAADQTFPDEVGRLRQKSASGLCELTKFAFDPSPDSRPFLANLFHIVYLYGTERFQSTDLLIEVNPRHVRFYQSMLGFERVGKLATNDKVSAPSQLLHISVEEIGRRIALCSDDRAKLGRSLYPYFFSGSEEEGVRQRVASFARRQHSSAKESKHNQRKAA